MDIELRIRLTEAARTVLVEHAHHVGYDWVDVEHDTMAALLRERLAGESLSDTVIRMHRDGPLHGTPPTAHEHADPDLGEHTHGPQRHVGGLPTCILTNADGENPDDCTTHEHEGGD